MPAYDLLEHKTVNPFAEPSESLQRGDLDPRVSEAYEIMEVYRSEQDRWAGESQEMREYWMNIQFTSEQIDVLRQRGQASTPINVVTPSVEHAIAMLTQNSPRWMALARDDSDNEIAKVISELFQWVWEENRGNMVLKDALYDYYIAGRGVLYAYIDPHSDSGNGDVVLMSLDPLDVYPDPNSQDRMWRDAANIFVERRMTYEAIQASWPEMTKKLRAASPNSEGAVRVFTNDLSAQQNQIRRGDINDSYHNKYRVLDRYSKIKVPYVRVVDLSANMEKVFLQKDYEAYLDEEIYEVTVESQEQMETSYATNDAEVREIDALYEKASPVGDGSLRMLEQNGIRMAIRPLVRRELTVNDNRLITSRKVLLTRVKHTLIVGDVVFHEKVLETEHYPIVPLNNKHNRNPYPLSDISYVKPLQDSLNKLHALMVANLATSTNQKILIPRGSTDIKHLESIMSKAGGAAIEYNAEIGTPVVVGALPTPNGLFQQFGLLVNLIQRTIGIFDLSRGDSSAAPNTFSATLALDEFGNRLISSKLDDMEQVLNHMATWVVFPMMQQTYTEKKVVRLVQPNNNVRESVINQLSFGDYMDSVVKLNDITTGRYDVVMRSGSTLPTNRIAEQQEYQRLFELGIIDQVEMLKKTVTVDMEGVLERSSMISQLQNALQQTQEQNKDLKGDLQTRERELFHAKLALEIERAANKTRQSLADTATEAEASRRIFEARAQDELSLAKRSEEANGNE